MIAASDLAQRLRVQVEAGKAAVFAPEFDWNIESPLTVQAWHDEWGSSLPRDEAKVLQGRASIVREAAHGLYISPRSGREATVDEDVRFQMRNVDALIDAGLDLLAD